MLPLPPGIWLKHSGNKKAGRFVFTHLTTGSGKPQTKWITTYHPRCICSSNTARVPYAYVHIRTGANRKSPYPSFAWNFPDFVVKEWSAERSFVSSGCLLCLTQTLQTILQSYVFYFICANFSLWFLWKSNCVRTQHHYYALNIELMKNYMGITWGLWLRYAQSEKWKVKSEKYKLRFDCIGL